MRRLHSSGLAGTWYPGEPSELAAEVDGFLAEASDEDPDMRALVVPHAGYRYSGRCAGAAWGRVPRGRWRRVVLMAPSHYDTFEGMALLPADGFETPLGSVPIDGDACAALLDGGPAAERPSAYRREHSLEIQLPFLQRIEPGLAVVPVLVRGGSEVLAAVGRAIRLLDDGESLFAVSSDFTHYGASFDYVPFPPNDAGTVAAKLRRLDFGAIDPLCRGERNQFVAWLEETGATVCGRDPLEAWLARNDSRLSGTVCAYYTSLDVTGDFEHSVSYASIAFSGDRPS